MKNHLSLEQRIRNAEVSQEVENVKSRHQYLHARADGATEYDHLWLHTGAVRWCHGFGAMEGYDQVCHGNVNDYEKMGMENWLKLNEIYPEVGGKDPRPLMECSVHALTCDVIEVADDGMSARASFITPGAIHCHLSPDESKWCHILWERYGSDFKIDETDGKLKYYTEHVCPDILTDLDYRDWAAEEYARRTDPNAPPPPPVTLGLPATTYHGPWHRDYNLFQAPQNDTPCPEPYAAFDENDRYGDPEVYKRHPYEPGPGGMWQAE